jgi:D-alanyl-D-alanine carboxypeptidase (penicillin-binding protein 5/6)
MGGKKMDSQKKERLLLKLVTAAAVFIWYLLQFGGAVGPAFGEEAVERKPPRINASSAVLIEAGTGRVLYNKNMDKKRAPASLTKMMTGILAVEMGKDIEIVNVSSFGASNKAGQDIGLRRNDQLTLADLTKAALLVSANDSTVAIGEHIGGSEDYFIYLMNMKAKSIGVYNTNFKNTNGYTEPNHYSTAYDLALIARYGMANANFASIVGLDEAQIKWLNRDREMTLINSNRLQHQHQWITGVKTGTTNAAGKCLAASGERNGRTLIAVVLNSSNRYGEALSLLEYGFSLEKKIFAQGERLGQLKIARGKPEAAGIVALESLTLFLTQEDKERLEIRIICDDESLSRFPVEKHKPIGKAAVFLAGEQLAQVPVGLDARIIRKLWQ